MKKLKLSRQDSPACDQDTTTTESQGLSILVITDLPRDAVLL